MYLIDTFLFLHTFPVENAKVIQGFFTKEALDFCIC